MLLVLKSLHLIFAITWFAALFYIPRLFIYQTEAKDAGASDDDPMIVQFKLMSKRLWFAIGWPSLVLNLLFGLSILHPYFSSMPAWLILKLTFVALLIGYHHLLHFTYKGLQNNVYKYSSQRLREINEISTIFLFAIVFLGVMKSAINFKYYIAGLVVLIFLLYMGIVMYKKKRTKS